MTNYSKCRVTFHSTDKLKVNLTWTLFTRAWNLPPAILSKFSSEEFLIISAVVGVPCDLFADVHDSWVFFGSYISKDVTFRLPHSKSKTKQMFQNHPKKGTQSSDVRPLVQLKPLWPHIETHRSCKFVCIWILNVLLWVASCQKSHVWQRCDRNRGIVPFIAPYYASGCF